MTLSKAIDSYYRAYFRFEDEEGIINAIFYLMKRDNKYHSRGRIRNNISMLSILVYGKYLLEIEGFTNEKFNEYRVKEFKKLDYILLRLEVLEENNVKLKKNELKRIIDLCQKLMK